MVMRFGMENDSIAWQDSTSSKCYSSWKENRLRIWINDSQMFPRASWGACNKVQITLIPPFWFWRVGWPQEPAFSSSNTPAWHPNPTPRNLMWQILGLLFGKLDEDDGVRMTRIFQGKYSGNPVLCRGETMRGCMGDLLGKSGWIRFQIHFQVQYFPVVLSRLNGEFYRPQPHLLPPLPWGKIDSSHCFRLPAFKMK